MAKTSGARYPVPRLDSEERKGLVSFCPLVVTIGNTRNPSQGDTPDHLRTARGDPTILKTETGTPEGGRAQVVGLGVCSILSSVTLPLSLTTRARNPFPDWTTTGLFLENFLVELKVVHGAEGVMGGGRRTKLKGAVPVPSRGS